MADMSAGASEVIRLWPDGPPTEISDVPPETTYEVRAGVARGTTFVRNISDPTLTVFRPSGASNGVGVVVAPGGGWTINAWSHEGVDVARLLTDHGYVAFVLKYRVQASDPDREAFAARMAKVDAGLAAALSSGKKPEQVSDLITSESYLEARAAAADDGRRAIELVRADADRFGIRPEALGVIGFSAGAFLAVDVALDPRAAPLAFIAAIYGGETRRAAVPDDAPPMFGAVARDDILGRIVEGVHDDWNAAGRSSELHVFARGQHGFGMVRQGLPSDHWTDLFLAWLADLDLSAK